MKNIILAIVMVLVFFSFCNSYVWADDVEEEIKSALDSYKARDYTAAISSLDFAAQQIRQLKADKIETTFPEPLPGWVAKSPKSSAMGGAFMGGMISNSRRYVKGDSSVEISIVSDSPMIQMITGMFSNPMFAAAPGRRVMKIKNRKALLQWFEDTKNGELQIVLDDNILVTISGEDCERSDIVDYANAIDYREIESLSSSLEQ